MQQLGTDRLSTVTTVFSLVYSYTVSLKKKCRTCAQFISAMKQVFQKYNIPMPHMPRAPRLTDIVIAPSNEGLPKAWELTTMWNSTSNNDAGETSSNEARYECILRADKTAHERFARECRVEKELRMKRKQTHVRLHKQIPPVRPARVTCAYVFGVNLFSFVLLFFCSFLVFISRYKIVSQDANILKQCWYDCWTIHLRPWLRQANTTLYFRRLTTRWKKWCCTLPRACLVLVLVPFIWPTTMSVFTVRFWVLWNKKFGLWKMWILFGKRMVWLAGYQWTSKTTER